MTENKADKGKRFGSCNRTACQRPGATWFNKTMNAWYCPACAHMINYNPNMILCEYQGEEFDAQDKDTK